MCIFKSPKVVIPEPKVDPMVRQAQDEATAKAEADKKKAELYQERVRGGKVGRRSLISGESGGIGFLK